MNNSNLPTIRHAHDWGSYWVNQAGIIQSDLYVARALFRLYPTANGELRPYVQVVQCQTDEVSDRHDEVTRWLAQDNKLRGYPPVLMCRDAVITDMPANESVLVNYLTSIWVPEDLNAWVAVLKHQNRIREDAPWASLLPLSTIERQVSTEFWEKPGVLVDFRPMTTGLERYLA